MLSQKMSEILKLRNGISLDLIENICTEVVFLNILISFPIIANFN